MNKYSPELKNKQKTSYDQNQMGAFEFAVRPAFPHYIHLQKK